jgi:hypothetical protein
VARAELPQVDRNRHPEHPPMKEVGRVARSVGVAFGLGFASGFFPLLPTYIRALGSYTDLVPAGGWLLGTVSSAVFLSVTQRDLAWALAVVVECGLVVGIVADVVLRASVGVESNVWPLAIATALFITIPPVMLGTFIGRASSKGRR